ncbi:MAG: hydroxymethylbilane synthase [Candidatus Omnitrophota bacterium]|nr:hydroxymethylbilane synthase [Candidatus Omnitrophota bacterium]
MSIAENKRFIIGSRSSKLALTQTRYVMDKLKKFHPSPNFEIKTIKTAGDKIPDVALSKIADKGFFTKEIEEALLRREIDLAVHSMKDLPTELSPHLKIAAVTKREDPRDVLVSREGFTLKTLPQGSRVGTSSLRRSAQLLYIRKDLKIMDLRGNLDTRINKLDRGIYDAIILAYAGIKRLGLTVKLSAISTQEMLPQAGQGALAIEAHEDNHEVINMAKALDDADYHLAIDAERAVLSGLGGGCQVPIGVYAAVEGDILHVTAGVFSLDGKMAVRDEISGKKINAQALGRQLAERVLEKNGAQQILRDFSKGMR